MEYFPNDNSTERLTFRQIITARVIAARRCVGHEAGALLDLLRTSELQARAAVWDRETIQIIASARRVLGDREDFSDMNRKRTVGYRSGAN